MYKTKLNQILEGISVSLRDRVLRRLSDLEADPDAFLARFDQNGDGELDENERIAAISTLLNLARRHDSFLQNMEKVELSESQVLNDRYQIVSQIGAGSQGIAYAARDRSTSSLVMVKQLRLSHLDRWESFDTFQREHEVLQKLDHPQIPAFIDAFSLEEEGRFAYYSVQSLFPGTNLEDLLSQVLFLEEDILSIAKQVLDILGFLHAHQPSLLHRDLKPSNLLLHGKQVYLVDFGAVQYRDSSKTLSVGTTGYMAPEQMQGEASPRSDLYGLGMTLIRLATGKDLQSIETKFMHLQWRPYASLSQDFSDWVDKLIEPFEEDRFKDANIALKYLEEKRIVLSRPSKSRRAPIDLTEIVKKRPKGTRIKMWESVDQFVCSFPASGKSSMPQNKLEKFEQHYQRIISRGGGFNIDSEGLLRMRANDAWVPINIQVDGEKTLLRIRNTNHLWGIDIYREGRFSFSIALLDGFSESEVFWVFEALSAYLDFNQTYV